MTLPFDNVAVKTIYCWLTMQLWGEYCPVSILSFVLWHKKIKTPATPQDLQKKLEFQHVLWASGSCILLIWGNFLPVLANDLAVHDDFPGPLLIRQGSFKSHLPSKTIYLSQTAGLDFFSSPGDTKKLMQFAKKKKTFWPWLFKRWIALSIR